MTHDRSPGPFRRVQFAIEYAAVRSLSALVALLPERCAVLLGRFLGRLYSLYPLRRRVVRRNISLARPGRFSGAELRRLVRDVFRNIGLTMIETIWMQTHATPENILERFTLDDPERVRQALAAGRGVMMLTCHLGNWELFGSCGAAYLGTLNALARPVNNPLAWRYLTGVRERMHINVLSTRDGVRPMIAALRRREPLVILVDQHVNRAFVPATFFGRPAATTAVTASLALRLDVPVFFVYSLRDGLSFRHHGFVEGPFELVRSEDHEADVLANTQLFNDRVEAAVRRHPEQWLWTHRRWKLADRPPKQSNQENPDDVGPTD